MHFEADINKDKRVEHNIGVEGTDGVQFSMAPLRNLQSRLCRYAVGVRSPMYCHTHSKL